MTEKAQQHIGQAHIIGSPPPETWQDYARDCESVFGGGYQTEGERRIFHHGIQTAFNVIEDDLPRLALCRDCGQMEVLVEAVREASGLLSLLEPQAQETIGWTNFLLLKQKVEAALAAHEARGEPPR